VTRTSAAARNEAHGERIEATAASPLLRIAPELASAVGSAVHSLLERMDWRSSTLETEWERTCVDVRQSLLVGAPAGSRSALGARFDAMTRTFRSGPFWQRLRELGPCLVARELPVLVAPLEGGEGPVGAGVGAIDLVYRDASGSFVVVDFKTDAVANAGTLDAKLERYREQGRAYQRAVQQSLELAAVPRFEFWFLAAGESRSLDA
jgi:ATP-dependent exoDNAse (exonuclease V) beta subunit